MLLLFSILNGRITQFPTLPTWENLNTYLKQKGMRLAINLLPEEGTPKNPTIRLWRNFQNFLMLWQLIITLGNGKPLAVLNSRLSYSSWTRLGFCRVVYLHILGLRILFDLPTLKIFTSFRRPTDQRIFPQRYARKLMSFSFFNNGLVKISKSSASGAARK